MNHSDHPNVAPIITKKESLAFADFKTLRKIKKGEELFIEYTIHQ